jgi:hypothetical protein
MADRIPRPPAGRPVLSVQHVQGAPLGLQDRGGDADHGVEHLVEIQLPLTAGRLHRPRTDRRCAAALIFFLYNRELRMVPAISRQMVCHQGHGFRLVLPGLAMEEAQQPPYSIWSSVMGKAARVPQWSKSGESGPVVATVVPHESTAGSRRAHAPRRDRQG